MEEVECLVIGAGVIGLAIARKLASKGREVVILESAKAFGSGISSRNSEVIHAGIYYPQGSLKAQLCLAGRDRLYRYCAEHNIGCKRIGKLIVATDENQIINLRQLQKKAAANGVDDLIWLDADAARKLEPELRCAAALLSPSTGIIDSHGLMLALLGEAEANGAALALNSPVLSGNIEEDRFIISVGGSQPMQIKSRLVINAAGLQAQIVARNFTGLKPSSIPDSYLAKGNYFTLSGHQPPFSRLIYPMPELGGLGIHVTLDLAGQTRFGPDVEWIENIDYQVDPARGEKFYAAIRRYWPAMPSNILQPGYAGIRPKLSRDKDQDFLIQTANQHGAPGLLNLFGIESPGLTASLAIADYAAAMVEQDLR